MIRQATVLVGILAANAFAQEVPDPLDARVLLSQSAVRLGDTFRVAVEVSTKGAYHIYGPKVAGDSGLVATSVSWEATDGLSVGKPQFPAPKRLVVQGAGKESEVYAGKVVITFSVTAGVSLPRSTVTLRGQLRYQACTKTTCLMPGKEALSIEIPIVAKGQDVRLTHPEVFARKVPGWNLTMMDGSKLSSEDFKGKAHIIDFWATWCVPCVKEVPGFVQLHKEYGERGFSVIGISMDRSSDAVRAFVKKHGVEYPVAMKSDEVVRGFEKVVGSVRTLPVTLIVDSNGYIRSVHRGFTALATFESEIEALMSKREEQKVVLLVEGMT